MRESLNVILIGLIDVIDVAGMIDAIYATHLTGVLVQTLACTDLCFYRKDFVESHNSTNYAFKIRFQSYQIGIL